VCWYVQIDQLNQERKVREHGPLSGLVRDAEHEEELSNLFKHVLVQLLGVETRIKNSLKEQGDQIV